MKSLKKNKRESFALPLPLVMLLGAVLSAVFYALIITGPLRYEVLQRYCLNHPVALACVSLFLMGCVSLVVKYGQALRQQQFTTKVAATLRRLTAEGQEIAPSQRAEWLAAHWQSVATSIRDSWLGTRLSQIVDLQVTRGRGHQLEGDLQMAADTDAERQHESYSLLRIINWAMPMLGFLGTVLGISQTLGQLDTQKLATQQQEAMNELTAGLYVAFDTTAIALVLTVTLMFLQFALSRVELKLLANMDSAANHDLIEYLATDPYHAEETLLIPMREMAEGLLASVKEVTQTQATIWARSIAESQKQWVTWTQTAAETIDTQLGEKITAGLQEHVAALQTLHEEASYQVDKRWQQWQTSLSDQSRIIQGQQKEMIRQGDCLQQLLESVADLRKLEEQIQGSVERLEDLNRLEEASTCVGEAVAVLAASLERAGVIRGTPIRPRPALRSRGDGEPEDASGESSEEDNRLSGEQREAA